MRLTLDHNTSNGALMMTADVVKDVMGGIDNPSDAVITAETSLYRVAHKQRYDRTIDAFVDNPPEAAYQSSWWATSYHFNAAIWANDEPDMSYSARAAFAIHPAWRSDCSNYANIVTTTDLSIWYGLGRIVNQADVSGAMLAVHPSSEVLQIYIPGFRTHYRLWSKHAQVIAFEKALSNGRGFQGALPLGLRPGSV